MAQYLTTGWESFAFIVTPAELEQVISDMHLLITSTHVPYDYTETPLGRYIDDYKMIYQKLITGQKVTISDIGNFIEIGITQSLEVHKYGQLHTYRGKKYLSKDFDEPCAILRLFPMYLNASKDDKPSLTIRASSIQFPENTVGLELLFPKSIQYPCGKDYSPLEPTKSLVSYQDYLILRDRIKTITKPLRLIYQDEEFRPRVRISKEALHDIDRFRFLQQNDIRAIT